MWSNIIPDNGPRAITRPLSDNERAIVQSRANELRASLQPFGEIDDDRVAAAIAEMFGGYRSMRQDEMAAVAIIASTRRLLSPFPAWAIEKGCMSIRRGEAGLDIRYVPNDGEIYKVIDKQVAFFRDRLRDADALLAAPIEEPQRSLPKIPSQEEPPPQMPVYDGKHGARVEAYLAERRARREAKSDVE